MPNHSQPPFPTTAPHLLNLPGEIRNQILEHLLVFSRPIPIYNKTPNHQNDTDTQQRSRPPLSLSQAIPLFLTNRQLHHEATAIFYSHNTFSGALLPPVPSRNRSRTERETAQPNLNLLFRHFLDRIGARNSSLLRRIIIPLPVDAEALVGNYLGTAAAASRSNDDGGGCASVLAALGERCPNLENVTVDISGRNHWVKMLLPYGETLKGVLGRVDEGLRGAFPALKSVRLCLAGSDRTWSVSAWFVEGALGITDAEWELVREVVEAGCGWEVTARDRYEEDEGNDSAWAMPGHVEEGRNPNHLLYAPPETIFQSEVHDQWTGWPSTMDRVWLAAAYLWSPIKATQAQEEAREWRAWKTRMVAQLTPITYSIRGSSASFRPLPRKSVKRGMRGFLASRR